MINNGIVLINKERGMSSNAVVNKVKRILNVKKAGHAGTLDVLGEGLLPVLIGKGTKLFDYLLQKDKTYKTTFLFGKTTSTLDQEGEIIRTDDITIEKEDLEKIIPYFIGPQLQMPPQFSAKKIGGKPAYSLARKGISVELNPKQIEIYSIKILGQVAFNTFELEVECSSGTYIRSLCRDIAEKLSTCGMMSSIQRTRCGIFNIKDTVTLKELEDGQGKVIGLDSIFDYRSVNLNLMDKEKLLKGVRIPLNLEEGLYKCYCDSVFLGIIKQENNSAKIILRLI